MTGATQSAVAVPLEQNSAQLSSWSVSTGKRLFDISMSLIGLVFMSPLMLLIALAIRSTSSGPVLFRQVRVGRHGAGFGLLKFRTMRNAPGPTLTRTGDPRVTSVGRVLRSTKLDELPQLFNVLVGDMTLVGPRPDLPQYWSTLAQRFCAIRQLRPGITGCASLTFSNEEKLLALIPEEHLNQYYISNHLPIKIQIDLDYATQASFLTDLRVLWATVTGLGKNAITIS
jgi:lipopolysaccharide/colanic/teichoic acid biosynthesis glycosyltransferase